MSIAKITSHVATAKSRLLEQFKGKDKIEALLEALVEQCHGCSTTSLEDVFEDLQGLVSIDDSSGAQLDLIGDILGVLRGEKTDAVYRVHLKAQIRLLRCEGTPEDLYDIAGLILGADAELRIVEQYPAALEFFVDTAFPGTVDVTEFTGIMESATPAGVRFVLRYHTTSTPFVFDGGDGLGFGDAGDPGVGGDLASAAEE